MVVVLVVVVVVVVVGGGGVGGVGVGVGVVVVVVVVVVGGVGGVGVGAGVGVGVVRVVAVAAAVVVKKQWVIILQAQYCALPGGLNALARILNSPDTPNAASIRDCGILGLPCRKLQLPYTPLDPDERLCCCSGI